MTNNFSYKTDGVCSEQIDIETIGGNIKSVNFEGGCDGNLKGLCKLLEGMAVDSAIDKLSGILCGDKDTSCPDQLAKALISAKKAGQI